MSSLAGQISESNGSAFIAAHYPLIQTLVRRVAWRQRLRPDELDELSSAVHLKLVENDYAVLRRFEGRSAWSTYLQTVITRVCLDARIAAWGKWRPSVQARRQGATAIRLERLLYRDGLSFAEACSTLRGDARVAETDEGLEQMRDSFPRRHRAQVYGQDVLDSLAPSAIPAPNPHADRDAKVAAMRLRRQVARAIASLPGDDRQLLTLRHRDGWTVARVAMSLRLEPKRAYREYERVYRTLRGLLIGAGSLGRKRIDGFDRGVDFTDVDR